MLQRKRNRLKNRLKCPVMISAIPDPPISAITAKATHACRVLLVTLMLLSPGAVPATEPGATIAPLAVDSLLLGGARAGDRLVVVGERGHILLSDDNGDNWRQVEVPSRTTLTAISFSDPQHGWAVGHDALILHSSDGGEHWQRQYQDIELQSPLLDVYFADNSHGLASGAYGLLLETTDGGQHWQASAVNADDDFHLNAIDLHDGQRLLAAEAGIAYRQPASQPGHQAGWDSLSTPYAGSFFDILALPDGSLLLAGLRGHLLRSTDNGGHWQQSVTDSSNSLTAILRLQDGRIAVAGAAGTVLLSNDNGISFQPLSIDGRANLSALLQAADGRLLGIGEKGIHTVPLPPLPSQSQSQSQPQSRPHSQSQPVQNTKVAQP